jgi:hypothetical protein
MYCYFRKSSRDATISADPKRALAPHRSDLRAGRALGLLVLRPIRSVLVTLAALGHASCGGQAALTPEIIGQQTFDALKADNFTQYFTTLVATKTIVGALCPGLPGIERYFESGEGSERLQNDRWVACRQVIDFSKATRTGVTVERKSPELVTPQCSNAIENVDVKVSVEVDGRAGSFTVGGIMQFGAGWRVYRRIKDCVLP